jgi:hypothetical protein
LKQATETLDSQDSRAPVPNGLFGWMGALETQERRVLQACIGGWALDAMDVQLYSFVIPALIATWGITGEQAGLLGTVALLVSAFGGWLAGWFADRYGRVRALQLAILWFAVFTFLSGLAQNYSQLFAARAFLGLGFGGEWAAGAVLLGEVIRPEHRGKALGVMHAGWLSVGAWRHCFTHCSSLSCAPPSPGVCCFSSASFPRFWSFGCGAMCRSRRFTWNHKNAWRLEGTGRPSLRFFAGGFCASRFSAPSWERELKAYTSL